MSNTPNLRSDLKEASTGPSSKQQLAKPPGSHKRLMRLAVFSAFSAIMAILVSSVGWLLWIESALSDRLFFRAQTAPSGKIMLVVVDDETIRKTGRFPYDRGQLADALVLMQQGGAKRIYLDTALSHVQNGDTDKKLELELARFSPSQLSLPITRMHPNAAHKTDQVVPLERFSQNATLTTFESMIEADGRIRHLLPPRIAGYQSAHSWLLGIDFQRNQLQTVLDFSIFYKDIPRVSLMDIADGNVKAEAFRDKLVIFGLVADAAGNKMHTPAGPLTRVEVLAIAAETALQERMIKRLSPVEKLTVTILVATMLGLTFLGVKVYFKLSVLPLLIFGWGAVVDLIFRKSGIILPLLPVFIVILIFWQRALMSLGAGLPSIRKIRNRLFGVDHSTLLIALDAMPDAAILFDETGKIIGQNQPFQAISTEFRSHNKSFASLDDFCGEESQHILSAAFENAVKTLVIKVQADDRQVQFFEIFPRMVESATGHICIAGLKDVTARVLREEELVTLAFRDSLTGLANRLSFQARLEAQCAQTEKQNFAVLLLDLDGFKKVNDTLGHDAGDQLLSGVAQRLQQLVPKHGLVARLGGDEFAIMQLYGSQGEIRDLAANIHKILQPVFMIDGKEARVGASIGIAYAPRDGLDARLLTKRADAAMYRAKRNKPSSCEFDHRFDGDTPGPLVRAQER